MTVPKESRSFKKKPKVDRQDHPPGPGYKQTVSPHSTEPGRCCKPLDYSIGTIPAPATHVKTRPAPRAFWRFLPVLSGDRLHSEL